MEKSVWKMFKKRCSQKRVFTEKIKIVKNNCVKFVKTKK